MEIMLLFREIDWSTVGYSVAIMGGTAILLAILIMVVSKIFEVKSDTRIDEIASFLPGANCGGCGYAGCRALAEAIVKGEAPIDSCGGNSTANKLEIASIMGVSYGGGGETVAVVACSGGNSCNDKYVYQGYGDCISQSIMAGGRKECAVGCMGVGSCVNACPYFAVEVREGVAEIDPAQCVSCGNCIKACPKKIIKRVPKDAAIYVACSSQCKGKDVTLVCKSGCIGCGICERMCPEGAIHLENNVPIIDYAKCTGCETCMQKCPRKVIKPLYPKN